MAKDALGHGSEGGWGAHPGTSDTSKKYISLHGRTDAVVRTSRMPEGYLWQHGKQYGYANNVSDAMDTVKSRVADEARYQTHEPVTVSQFDGPRERSGLGAHDQAVKDFKEGRMTHGDIPPRTPSERNVKALNESTGYRIRNGILRGKRGK